MSTRVLITGITGFIGSHLAELLLGKGCAVYGTLFDRFELSNVEGIVDRLELIDCDLCNAAMTEHAVAQAQPDLVFHLAACTGGRAARVRKDLVFQVNVLGTMNLLEAVRTQPRRATVLIPISSAVFGVAERPREPITEETPYHPVNVYGASKAAQAMLARQYGRTYDLNIIRLHTFNCIGPRQSDQFACSSFARQIAEIEKGLRPATIEVGDLNTHRDLTDVRDVARAYWLATQTARPGEVYNVCSGQAYHMGTALEELIRLSAGAVEVRPKHQCTEPPAIPYQVGDASKFRALSGWQPTIAVERSLADTLGPGPAASSAVT